MARAALLQERLRLPAGEDVPPDPDLLDRWRAAVEPRGTSWFGKRLHWDDLTASPALVHPAAGKVGGAWPDVLREICRAAPGCTGAERPDGDAVPFEELLLPAVLVGRRRLLERLRPGAGTDATDVVTTRAYEGLAHDLLAHLSWSSEEVLGAEFLRSVAGGLALTAALGFAPPAAPGRARYEAFVREHLDTGWLTLLDRYPVLGRRIAASVALWVDATAELVERLRIDRGLLTRTFGIPDDARVDRFVVGLGDRHLGGRSVTLVEFDDGSRVVYKPKPLAMEASFNRLLDWLDDAGADPPLGSTTVLDRGGHGWTAYVGHRQCTTAEEVARYYTRAGMLLAVLHLLRATDCHYENLIAAGDRPVMVDAETLMYPDPRPLDPSDAVVETEGLRDRMLGVSVLRVGLLPQWRVHAGIAYDNSGLAATSGRGDGTEDGVLAWVDVNTDAMRRVRVRPRPPDLRHVVRLDGREQSVLDHREALIDGFRSAYRLLARHRDELLAPDGPLADMRRCPTRFIHRATRFYGSFLAGSRDPDLQGSGIDLGLYLEQLARAYLPGPARPAMWPVFADEVRAVGQLDVPLLTTRPDTRDLWCGDGAHVPDAFVRPAYDTVAEQLALFCEDDLTDQVRVIEASLAARAGRRGRRPSLPFPDPAPEPAEGSELLAAALDVGRGIADTAVTDGAGSVNWIGLQYLDEGDCHQVDVLNDFLYDGAAGVAVFLSALFRVTGDDEWRDLALRALAGPRRRLTAVEPSSRELAARLRGIGGGSGLGGLLYALTTVAGRLGTSDGLLDDALDLARWFTPATVAEDDRLDVLAGSAGTLLALLSLHRATGDDDVLARALDCGDHLMRATAPPGDGDGAPPRLTGFGHGAAGLALALARLAAAASETAFLDRARAHLEYERSLFSIEHGNWPDLRRRRSEAGMWPVKWCHGAAGITLSRLGIRRLVDLPGLGPEIAAGLATTRANHLQDLDSVCCGTMGRTEVFAVAADVLDDPALGVLARSGAAAVLARRARDGDYRLFPGDGLHHPGFFQGTAGIGYQLLRLTEPSLPSVLLWD